MRVELNWIPEMTAIWYLYNMDYYKTNCVIWCLVRVVVRLDINRERCDIGCERVSSAKIRVHLFGVSFLFTACYRAFFINLTDDLEELSPKLLFLRHGVRALSSSSSVRPLMEGSTKVLMGHWCLLGKMCIKCLTRD